MKKNNQGFVLITVLLIVTLLAALLLGINAELRNEAKTVSDLKTKTQDFTTARSGLNIAISAIQNDPDLIRNKIFTGNETVKINNSECTIKIQDENAKLNANFLTDKKGKPDRTRVDQLLKLIDLYNTKNKTQIPYSLAANLIDWTDKNKKPTWLDFVSRDNTGDETGCPNRPFATHRELRLVKDMPEFNDLTVYGNGKININTASSFVLQSLTQKLTAPIAQSIINAREIKPFASISELKTLSTITETIYRTIQLAITAQPQNRYYQITVQANTQTITAIINHDDRTQNTRILYYRES